MGIGHFANKVDTTIYVIAKSSAAGKEGNIDLIHGKKQNFKCAIDSVVDSTDLNCSIKNFDLKDFSENNNQIILSEFKSKPANNVTNTSQIKANQFFKLTVSESFFKKLDWTNDQILNLLNK